MAVTQSIGNNGKYLNTIKAIRKKNFSRNIPFLILSDKLPEGQVYREYPDGRIEIQEVFSVGTQFHSKLIEVLSPEAAERLRIENELL